MPSARRNGTVILGGLGLGAERDDLGWGRRYKSHAVQFACQEGHIYMDVTGCDLVSARRVSQYAL